LGLFLLVENQTKTCFGMKVAIIYESYFGNTEKIAMEIGKALSSAQAVQILNAAETEWGQVADAELIIVGSPTRGFQPCENTKSFLKTIPKNGLKDKKAAAFDTRASLTHIRSKTLRWMVKTGGYAAKPISKSLIKKGGELVVPPEGFLVMDEKGPLLKGEAERAVKWAKSILAALEEFIKNEL
jgi:flavodoxin